MESIIATHDEAACSDEEMDVEEPFFSEASSSSEHDCDLYQGTESNSDLSESSDEEEPEVPTM